MKLDNCWDGKSTVENQWKTRAVRCWRSIKTNVLLKGGHLAGEQAIDLLFTASEMDEFSAPFIRDIATHGTGCTYSAAITAGLALGKPLEQAVGEAKRFVTHAINRHFRWGKNLDALNQT